MGRRTTYRSQRLQIVGPRGRSPAVSSDRHFAFRSGLLVGLSTSICNCGFPFALRRNQTLTMARSNAGDCLVPCWCKRSRARVSKLTFQLPTAEIIADSRTVTVSHLCSSIVLQASHRNCKSGLQWRHIVVRRYSQPAHPRWKRGEAVHANRLTPQSLPRRRESLEPAELPGRNGLPELPGQEKRRPARERPPRCPTGQEISEACDSGRYCLGHVTFT